MAIGPTMLGPNMGGASISDILTALKNVVVALSNIGGYVQSLYNNVATVQMFSGSATTSVSTLYTASSGARAHINCITVCNTAGAAATFSIYIVPSGGAASASNAIYSGTSISANTTFVTNNGLWIIPPGGSVQASASAATVSFNLSGGGTV
jgi:hypothetical protein